MESNYDNFIITLEYYKSSIILVDINFNILYINNICKEMIVDDNVDNLIGKNIEIISNDIKNELCKNIKINDINYDIKFNEIYINEIRYNLIFLYKNNLNLLEKSEEVNKIGHWEWDTIKDEMIFSQGMKSLLKMNINEKMSFNKFILNVNDDDKIIIKNLINKIKPNEIVEFIYKMKTKSDNEFPRHFYTICKGIFYNDKLIKIIGYSQDITEKKILEKDLKETKSFLNEMSHEIRNPINGLLGMCSLLETTELANEQKEYIDIINMSVNGLLEIVNQILDLSKINSNKIILEKNNINIREYICLFIKKIENSVKKNVELLYEINDNVPEIINSDKNRINQVLLNFVTNSIKFTEKGYIKIIIEYTSNEISFKVIDTGIGISKKNQHNIFKEFYQENQNIYGGTGLGLSISKKIIKLMNGNIGFTSEQNYGSTFWFSLCIN